MQCAKVFRSSWIWVGLLAAGMVTLAGCGSGEEVVEGRPETVPVTGVVTHNGQPVEGANVVLHPQGGATQSAFGLTDAEGKFTLTTFESGDGAPPGQYAVTVVKTDTPAATPEATSEEEYVPPEFQKQAAPAKPKNLLPKKYESATTSGLTANVTAEGENQVKLELKD